MMVAEEGVWMWCVVLGEEAKEEEDGARCKDCDNELACESND